MVNDPNNNQSVNKSDNTPNDDKPKKEHKKFKDTDVGHFLRDMGTEIKERVEEVKNLFDGKDDKNKPVKTEQKQEGEKSTTEINNNPDKQQPENAAKAKKESTVKNIINGAEKIGLKFGEELYNAGDKIIDKALDGAKDLVNNKIFHNHNAPQHPATAEAISADSNKTKPTKIEKEEPVKTDVKPEAAKTEKKEEKLETKPEHKKFNDIKLGHFVHDMGAEIKERAGDFKKTNVEKPEPVKTDVKPEAAKNEKKEEKLETKPEQKPEHKQFKDTRVGKFTNEFGDTAADAATKLADGIANGVKNGVKVIGNLFDGKDKTPEIPVIKSEVPHIEVNITQNVKPKTEKVEGFKAHVATPQFLDLDAGSKTKSPMAAPEIKEAEAQKTNVSSASVTNTNHAPSAPAVTANQTTKIQSVQDIEQMARVEQIKKEGVNQPAVTANGALKDNVITQNPPKAEATQEQKKEPIQVAATKHNGTEQTNTKPATNAYVPTAKAEDKSKAVENSPQKPVFSVVDKGSYYQIVPNEGFSKKDALNEVKKLASEQGLNAEKVGDMAKMCKLTFKKIAEDDLCQNGQANASFKDNPAKTYDDFAKLMNEKIKAQCNGKAMEDVGYKVGSVGIENIKKNPNLLKSDDCLNPTLQK